MKGTPGCAAHEEVTSNHPVNLRGMNIVSFLRVCPTQNTFFSVMLGAIRSQDHCGTKSPAISF